MLGAGSARAETGVMFGFRRVSLVGDYVDANEVAFAVAGVVMRALPHGFAIGLEPGVRRSGSREIRLFDLVGAASARWKYQVSTRDRVRITAALAPAYRLASDRKERTDDGDEWDHVPRIRAWDLDAVAGVGWERAEGSQRYFVEARYAWGLVSIDAGELPLAVYRREVGLWFGVAR